MCFHAFRCVLMCFDDIFSFDFCVFWCVLRCFEFWCVRMFFDVFVVFWCVFDVFVVFWCVDVFVVFWCVWCVFMCLIWCVWCVSCLLMYLMCLIGLMCLLCFDLFCLSAGYYWFAVNNSQEYDISPLGIVQKADRPDLTIGQSLITTFEICRSRLYTIHNTRHTHPAFIREQLNLTETSAEVEYLPGHRWIYVRTPTSDSGTTRMGREWASIQIDVQTEEMHEFLIDWNLDFLSVWRVNAFFLVDSAGVGSAPDLRSLKSEN